MSADWNPPKETLRNGARRQPMPPPLPRQQPQTSLTRMVAVSLVGGVLLWGIASRVRETLIDPPAATTAAPGPAPDPAKAREDATARAEHEAADKQRQEKFIVWLKGNTAVTDAAFNSNSSLFVSLKPEKYTTPENVSEIASTISRWWFLQCPGASYVNTHIYRNGKEYASGSHGGL